MSIRVVAALLAVASACGPPSAPVVPATTLAGDPLAAGEPTTLRIPQPLVEIPLIVKDLEGYYLFDDEQLEAAKIIAAWAKGAGLTTEPPERTREIFRRAANGQHVVTGKACGGALWSLAAIERWRDELHAEGRIEASVACEPACVLTVKISEGLDAAARDAGRTALWTAAFDPAKPWRGELTRRLAELKPQEVLPDAPPPSANRAPLRPAAPDPAFARAEADGEEVLPAAMLVGAQACLGDVGAVGLVLEVDATATVTRCESYAHRIVANGPVAACACKALAGRNLGAGGARRVATTVLLPAGTSTIVTKGGKLVDARIAPVTRRDAGTGLYLPVASHRSVREWEPPMPWTVAACFTGLAPTATTIRASLVLHVDGTAAAITRTDITPASGALSPAETACVREAIRRATKLPCPDPGTHTMSAELVVELRDP